MTAEQDGETCHRCGKVMGDDVERSDTERRARPPQALYPMPSAWPVVTLPVPSPPATMEDALVDLARQFDGQPASYRLLDDFNTSIMALYPRYPDRRYDYRAVYSTVHLSSLYVARFRRVFVVYLYWYYAARLPVTCAYCMEPVSPDVAVPLNAEFDETDVPAHPACKRDYDEQQAAEAKCERQGWGL